DVRSYSVKRLTSIAVSVPGVPVPFVNVTIVASTR
ncbi:unnamed protein product, partial [marine sediment metagenome]